MLFKRSKGNLFRKEDLSLGDQLGLFDRRHEKTENKCFLAEVLVTLPPSSYHTNFLIAIFGKAVFPPRFVKGTAACE